MPRDIVDSSLIVEGRRKRKLASDATNEDNWSADRTETIKRMKKNAGLTESQTSLEQDSDEGTHPCRDGSLGSRNPVPGSQQSHSQRINDARGSATGLVRHEAKADGSDSAPEDPATPSHPDSPHEPEIEQIKTIKTKEDHERDLGKLVQYLSLHCF